MTLPVGTWALGLVDNTGASTFDFEDTMSFPPPRPPMHLPGMPPLPPMMPPPYPLPPMGGMIPVGMGMMPAPMMAPVPMTVPAPIPIPTPNKAPPKKSQQQMNKKSDYHSNERHSMRSYNSSMSRGYHNYQGNNTSNSSKGPPVTVFVGNITDRASDSLIRLLLQRCGTVVNWKRVQGANGKLQAFGFCEYADPESALRAIRLLHDWEIGDRKLVVKVDAKTKEKLDEYKASKKPKSESIKSGEIIANREGEEKGSGKEAPEEEELDEQTKRDDASVRDSIVLILRDHSLELSRPYEYKEKSKKMNKSQDSSKNNQDQGENDPKNNLDELELEEEKKSLIHREIDKFRDTYKRAEEEKERDRERKDKDRKERETRDNRESRNSRDRDNRRLHDSPHERPRFRNRNREKSRDREQSPWERKNRDYRNRSRDRGSDRSRSQSRDREWSREREQSRERTIKENFGQTRTKDKDWEKEKEEEEEAYEKKRLERKLREKEAAYQERLRNWEAREYRRAKEYAKERQKEEEKRREELKEARRLKEFLEDYDDERDDPKYYKGSALARRLKEREKEIEADARDRQREKEELEELRRKLAEDGHPDPEAEAKRIQQEEEERMMKPKIKQESPISENEPEAEVEPRPKMKPIGRREPSASPEREERPTKKVIEDENTQNSLSGFSDIVTPVEETKPMGFPGLKLGVSSPGQQVVRSPTSTPTSNVSISVPVVSKKKKITVDEVFTAHDEDSSDQPKKRKLIPLDDTSDDSKSGSQMTTEEKRKHIKNLIDKIPTAKEQLFAYNLDWSLVDNSLMEMRIRPWINKKIVEYIGEEEPTLVDFICSKVLAGSAANSILEDVSMVLDEEAEVFVVKMWRLLIYEIEAKKLGLVK